METVCTLCSYLAERYYEVRKLTAESEIQKLQNSSNVSIAFELLVSGYIPHNCTRLKQYQFIFLYTSLHFLMFHI